MMERKTIFDPKIMAILGGWVEPATPEELCTMYESAARAYAARLDEVEPRLEKLQAELSAAKALLKKVFGEQCGLSAIDGTGACLARDIEREECKFRWEQDWDGTNAEVADTGRRPDCPYLPWEEK